MYENQNKQYAINVFQSVVYMFGKCSVSGSGAGPLDTHSRGSVPDSEQRL